jgi:glyoxylase-like metal-dependent hydrolase (beta-lactamase superfamily II)
MTASQLILTNTTAPVVEVYALPTGHLVLPDRWIFQDGDIKVNHRVPDFSFLIVHPSGKKTIFDLGLRKDLDRNPVIIQNDYPILKLEVPEDASDILLRGPIKPSEIDSVILSHLHFDHTGDVTKFPAAKIWAGAGSRATIAPGWPRDPNSPFLSEIIEHPRYCEVDEHKYVSIECEGTDFPFERCYDFFGDGSFYLLDTPGHMKGHQGAFAKTGENEWVAMGGDCCHHPCFLHSDNQRDISIDVGPNGQPGFHKFPHAARDSISRAGRLAKFENILYILAHDASLEGVIPLYPAKLNGWKSAGYEAATKQ